MDGWMAKDFRAAVAAGPESQSRMLLAVPAAEDGFEKSQ